MIVVGGFYHERCVTPRANDGFGSGGRAAVALTAVEVDVDWYYYCPANEQGRVSLQLPNPYLNHFPEATENIITFRYFHPLSKPIFSPFTSRKSPPIKVEDEVVLRFGFMEGSAIVKGDRVVYDPQSPDQPIQFHENGSTAESLAIVLNAKEVLSYGRKQAETEAVRAIFEEDQADVVLVKAGAHGCRVYENGELVGKCPPYQSQRIYKIGSGDVFSAAFTYHWAILKKAPLVAADAASRCTSRYCETRMPTVELGDEAKNLVPVSTNKRGKVYIAGPFFTASELWLIEETWSAFTELGVILFAYIMQ